MPFATATAGYETFTWTSDWDLQEEIQYLNEETDMDLGMKHVRNLCDEAIITWSLEFVELSPKALEVRAFFKEMLGTCTIFNWYCPLDGLWYLCRFTGTFQRKIQQVSGDSISTFTVKIIVALIEVDDQGGS